MEQSLNQGEHSLDGQLGKATNKIVVKCFINSLLTVQLHFNTSFVLSISDPLVITQLLPLDLLSVARLKNGITCAAEIRPLRK